MINGLQLYQRKPMNSDCDVSRYLLRAIHQVTDRFSLTLSHTHCHTHTQTHTHTDTLSHYTDSRLKYLAIVVKVKLMSREEQRRSVAE